jgi:hypothetical protein
VKSAPAATLRYQTQLNRRSPGSAEPSGPGDRIGPEIAGLQEDDVGGVVQKRAGGGVHRHLRDDSAPADIAGIDGLAFRLEQAPAGGRGSVREDDEVGLDGGPVDEPKIPAVALDPEHFGPEAIGLGRDLGEEPAVQGVPGGEAGVVDGLAAEDAAGAIIAGAHDAGADAVEVDVALALQELDHDRAQANAGAPAGERGRAALQDHRLEACRAESHRGDDPAQRSSDDGGPRRHRAVQALTPAPFRG